MDLRTLLVILHIIGTALGVGAATVSDMLFFKFAKDGRIDKDEFSILKDVARIVWLGLTILIGSGIALVGIYAVGISDATYNEQKLFAKVIIVAILLANGIMMHAVVLPLFAARLGKSFHTPSFVRKSKIIFTAGAISVVSWYSALLLGAWRTLPVGYLPILATYLVVLCIAILVSNAIGIQFLRHVKKQSR